MIARLEKNLEASQDLGVLIESRTDMLSCRARMFGLAFRRARGRRTFAKLAGLSKVLGLP